MYCSYFSAPVFPLSWIFSILSPLNSLSPLSKNSSLQFVSFMTVDSGAPHTCRIDISHSKPSVDDNPNSPPDCLEVDLGFLLNLPFSELAFSALMT